MKKLFIIIMLIMILTACSINGGSVINDSIPTSNNNVTNNSTSSLNKINFEYMTVNITWPPFFEAQKLIDYIDLVFIGEVIDITFRIVDKTTAKTPTEDTEERHKELGTIYHVIVNKTYKGSTLEQIQVEFLGGLRDYKVEEQLKLFEEYNMPNVIYLSNRPDMKIGETYLFLASSIVKDEPVSTVDPLQSIYNIKKPYAKPAGISVQDVISHFGEDKWKEFLEIWG